MPFRKYMYWMPFPFFPKAYSVDLSLCQRLNASFDWIFNGFWSLPNHPKHFCARAGAYRPERDQRAKMLRPIRKRPNPLNIQLNDASNRWQRKKSTEYSIKRLISRFWEKGKRHWVHRFAYWSYGLSLCSFECCTACILRFVIRRPRSKKSMKT